MNRKIVYRFLILVVIVFSVSIFSEQIAMAGNDYNWPDRNDESNKDYNWYNNKKVEFETGCLGTDSVCDSSKILKKDSVNDSYYEASRTWMSSKANTGSTLITEATVSDVSGFMDIDGAPFSMESWAYKSSVAVPIYNSAYAYRCGLVYSLSADGGSHWVDVYPGQNVKFEYSGSDLRWKVHMWSVRSVSGGNCSPYINSVDIFYNSGVYHKDHTSNEKNFAYNTIYYKTVPSMPVIPEGSMIRVKGGIDVYIVKYYGTYRSKRLILSPSVFKSYRHLKWGDIIDVDSAVINSFDTSNLVQVKGDEKVWELSADGDSGIKRWNQWPVCSIQMIYEINEVDRDSYVTGDFVLGHGRNVPSCYKGYDDI